jgi:hypothetical protein
MTRRVIRGAKRSRHWPRQAACSRSKGRGLRTGRGMREPCKEGRRMGEGMTDEKLTNSSNTVERSVARMVRREQMLMTNKK